MEEVLKEISDSKKKVEENEKENRILNEKIYNLKLQLKILELETKYGTGVIDKTIKNYAEFYNKKVSEISLNDIINSSAGIDGWIKYSIDQDTN